ncbi:hypothetical protein HDV06_002518 [Boothiomyces sp. JEL0866]|nr:hypothetical protein HDV06_002518 [Boothiomyces sp. JEL0866]
MLTQLPIELLYNIIAYLPDIQTLQRTARTCKRLFHLYDEYSIKRYLNRRYGVPLSLYYAYEKEQCILDEKLIRLLVEGGSLVPRFLAQSCQKSNSQINIYILEHAKRIYNQQEFAGDDVASFEYLSNDFDLNFNDILGLMQEYSFIPLPELTPTAVIRLLKIIQKDIDVFDWLLNVQGLFIPSVNDGLIRMMLTNPPNKEAAEQQFELLKHVLSHGFKISDDVILCQLRNYTSPELFQILDELVPYARLKDCAMQVLNRMFGPNGSFIPDIASSLIEHFQISLDEIRPMILYTKSSRQSGQHLPYQTRSYEQERVVEIWYWVVTHYSHGTLLIDVILDDYMMWLSQSQALLKFRSFKIEIGELLMKSILECRLDSFKPRHLEQLSKVANISEWSKLCLNTLSQLQDAFSSGYYKNDLDLLWLWSLNLRYSLNNWVNSPNSQNITFLNKTKQTLTICNKQISEFSIERLDIPKLDLVRYRTNEGTVRYAEHNTHLELKKTLTDESVYKKNRFNWFKKSFVVQDNKIQSFFRNVSRSLFRKT